MRLQQSYLPLRDTEHNVLTFPVNLRERAGLRAATFHEDKMLRRSVERSVTLPTDGKPAND